MKRYVALLRGINVGAAGKGRKGVPMARLRELVEGCGGERVATYIQSGGDGGGVRAPLGTALLVVFALLAACGDASQAAAADPAWLDELLQRDPALGGVASMEHRLRHDPLLVWVEFDDPAEHDRRLATWLSGEEVGARRLLRTLVDEALATPVLEFLRSDAGRAASGGELMLLTASSFLDGEGLRAAVLRVLGDPERVGDNARARVAELQQAWRKVAGEVTPRELEWLLAGASVTAEQSQQIAAFYATEPGRRWLEVRVIAVAQSRQAYDRTLDMLRASGRVKGRFDALDRFLPSDRGR